jgi:hypothetical protein
MFGTDVPYSSDICACVDILQELSGFRVAVILHVATHIPGKIGRVEARQLCSHLLGRVGSVAAQGGYRPVTVQVPAARSISRGRMTSPATRSPSCRCSFVTQTCALPIPAAVPSARSRSTYGSS